MKTLICLLVFTLTSYAQTNTENTTKLNHTVTGEKVYLVSEVDIKPKLMYGENALYRFLSRNFKFPKSDTFVTEIVCSFIVEVDGTFSDIKVINKIPDEYKIELLRVMNKFDEPWYPAVKDQNQVRCQYVLPIKINLM
ncbi:hypothetical protein EQG68_08285 [Flavobacterium piscinae]|uniref:TonB C-terminal domain-containing protein n=1 Tax=Flavobacterium piscinae TaxID=2506424 RepID=A0A4Q1KQD9_9FLAO|nr:hypothetical protein [Flavobacterium piscinae]RXR32228.1 hypothetical protein EQG68_08285 [Flavobacterium piscinae]